MKSKTQRIASSEQPHVIDWITKNDFHKSETSWNLYPLSNVVQFHFKKYNSLSIEPHIVTKSKYINTNTIMLSEFDNTTKKSKKIGTLLLIGIISMCGIMTATVLPTPWSLVAIGFGGPLITLIKRLFK